MMQQMLRKDHEEKHTAKQTESRITAAKSVLSATKQTTDLPCLA